MSMESVPGNVGPETSEGRRLSGGAIASIGGVSILGIFMVQNTNDVTVNFLFWDLTLPIWLLILGAAVFGALVWLGIGVLRRHQRRKDRRDDRRD